MRKIRDLDAMVEQIRDAAIGAIDGPDWSFDDALFTPLVRALLTALVEERDDQADDIIDREEAADLQREQEEFYERESGCGPDRRD